RLSGGRARRRPRARAASHRVLAPGAGRRLPSLLQGAPGDPGRPSPHARALRAVRGGRASDRQRPRAARRVGTGDDVMAARRRRGSRTGTVLVLIGIAGVLTATFLAGVW